MTIPVGTFLRVVAVMNWLDGEVAQNVFNAVIGGAAGPYDEADIVADALDWVETMYDTITDMLSDNLDGAEIRVYEYDPVDDDFDEVGSSAWVQNFSSAAENLPRGVAMLINCKTIDPDVNGKKYIPGLTEAASEDGLWTAAFITQLLLFAAEWVGPFTGATSTAPWVPGVWSPTRTLGLPMSGTVLAPTIPAYQRRRKEGVGI